MAQSRKLRAALVVLVLLLGSVWTVPAAASAAPRCTKVRIPISITGGSGVVAGTLCVPPGARTIQVLVPGFSYARYYWDFPYQPEKYSYVRHANRAGYATLAIDRIGTGESYHPLSLFDTFDANADAVHQVVQSVRRDNRFDKIVLAGHSYGSLTAYRAAGRYRDVDALVITGGAHSYNLMNLATKVVLNAPPAALSPKFGRAGLDPGYIAPKPGNRTIFYAPGRVDPKVLATDERLRQTGTYTELATVAPYPLLDITRKVNIPVYTIIGTKDPFFCGPMIADCSSDAALTTSERRFYGPHATVEASIVRGAGHNLNLERTSRDSFARVTDFLDRHLGA